MNNVELLTLVGALTPVVKAMRRCNPNMSILHKEFYLLGIRNVLFAIGVSGEQIQDVDQFVRNILETTKGG